MSSASAVVMRWIPSFLQPWVARVQNSPLGYRLARGAFWSLLGTLISQGLGFVALILVARMLGKEGFGELGVIQNTVGMFGVFAGFGLGVTATKHVAEFRVRDPEKAGRIMTLCGLVAVGSGGLMALVLVLVAPWLAEHTLAAPHLSGLLQVGAGLLLLNALNGTQTGALAGFEAFRTITMVNLWAGLTKFPLIVGGVYLAGVTGAVWGLVAGMGIHWILNHLALRRETRRAGVPFGVLWGCGQEWKVLYGFSLPALLSGAMVAPVQWISMAMLVNQPGGYAEMGIYNAALAFKGIIVFLGNTLNMPLLSVIANEKVSSQRRLSRVNIIVTWSLGVFIALPLLSFPELPQMIYGNKFSNFSFKYTFVLIVFISCIFVYKQGLTRVLTAGNLLWWVFLSNLIWGVLFLSSAFFLVKWGAIGIAAAFAFSYISSTVVFLPWYLRLGLIPKNTIISFEAVVIWLVIIFLVLMNWIEASLMFRAACFPISIALCTLSFRYLIKKG